MARVTVEDCVIQVPNRFDLVLLASLRARSLASGAELLVERDRDKNPVVALREIAEEKLDLDTLKEALVKGLQKRIEPDPPEEEVADLMAAEQQNWIGADMAMDADAEDDLEGEDTEEEDIPSENDLSGNDANFEDAEPRD